MNQRKRSAFIAGVSVFAAGAAFAQTAPATQGAATPTGASVAHAGFVKSVQGNVRPVGPSGEQRPLKVGDSVEAASRIESEPGSGAGVVLRDGTVLVLG